MLWLKDGDSVQEYVKNERKDIKHKVHHVEVKEGDSSDSDAGLVMSHSTGATAHSDCWIINSRAVSHICHERKQFVNFESLKTTQEVTHGELRSKFAGDRNWNRQTGVDITQWRIEKM